MSGSRWIHTFSEGPNLIDGQWHTIALTYNGAGNLSLYNDHSFVQTATSAVGYNTTGDNDNYLGTLYNGSSYIYKFVGDLKDIAFYDYALTALQATTDDSITE